MPKYDFRLVVVTQTYENETCLAEALFFPDVSRYGAEAQRLHGALRSYAQQATEDLALLDLYRSHVAGAPALDEVTIILNPPPRSVAWRRPISLHLPLVRWSHGNAAHIAFVPALGIEVIAEAAEDLEKRVLQHVHAELLRAKTATSLAQMVWLPRSPTLRIDELTFTANLRSPKQRAAQMAEDKETSPSVLEEVAADLTKAPLAEAYEIDDLVAHLAEALAGKNPRSVLLVGPSGVGKTAAVHALVKRRQAYQLGRTPFWASSGARLVAGMSGFGMWQDRCQRLWREASKQKAILYLGHLVELMEVGKSACNTQGIAGFFRPYLARGDMQAIVECTPEQLPLIEREDPHLLNVFYQIKVPEPNAEKGKSILLSYALARHSRAEAPIALEGIEVLDRLHRRYATYSAYPGRPLRFLRNLLQDRAEGVALTATDVTSAFGQETGLPSFLLDEATMFDPETARAWFTERVMGQPEAVAEVVNLLATIKAGLTRPRKPIASLLLIGPTGTGKTEMAKSLAEFLFRDRHRMIRFDMSEYADPRAAQRLIGGAFGAEGLLTAKVREQPFAVVLLDEFEKAHPLVFDLLLQVLGEGRLTDAAGRVADFCNAVVVMTSNIGADSFQRGAVGFFNDPAARAEASRHFINEVRAFVRPELFNRIDRILSFAPLDEETVLRIAHRELEQLQARDGIHYRGVTLRTASDVPIYLARKGYDPRYGARPLKRTIERELLVPLAEGCNRYASDAALQAEVRVEQDGLRVTVRARIDDAGKPVSTVARDAALAELTARSAEMRRKIQTLERSPAAVELYNEIVRLEQLGKRIAQRRWKRPEDSARLAQLPKRRQVAAFLASLSERAVALEDNVLFALYGRVPVDKERVRSELSAVVKEWRDVLLALYSLQFKWPDYVTLAVYSEHPERTFALAHAYYTDAIHRAAQVGVVQFVTSRSGRADGMALKRLTVLKPREFLATPQPGTIGLALGIDGALVFPRYEPERGLHVFVDAKATQKCLVHTSEVALVNYEPPEGVDHRGFIGRQDQRRTYDYSRDVVDDAALGKRYTWRDADIAKALAIILEERLMADAESLVE